MCDLLSAVPAVGYSVVRPMLAVWVVVVCGMVVTTVHAIFQMTAVDARVACGC